VAKPPVGIENLVDADCTTPGAFRRHHRG